MFGIDDLVLGGLAFGGKLLSGLGAAQSASKANKRAANIAAFIDQQNAAVGQNMINRYSTQNIVPDAQAAGFNPVTFLNAMGGMYSSGQLQGWGMMTRHAPEQTAVPSTLSAIGGAITAGADSLQSSAEADAKVTAAQENMQAYIKAVQGARAKGNPMAGLGTPAFSTAASARSSGGGAAAALSMQSADTLPGVKDRSGEVSSVYGPVDSSFPDAMATERRYGFLGAGAAGLANFGVDAWRQYVNPRAADPAKDYGFGTRFAPNIANDRYSPTGALSPYKAPSWDEMYGATQLYD